jgi:hypothetical protein
MARTYPARLQNRNCAYLYFYPLLSAEVTRKQFSSIGPDTEGAASPDLK